MTQPPCGSIEPAVLGFGGRSRAGKSTISRLVSPLLGWKYASFGGYVREVTAARGLNPDDLVTLMNIGEELVEYDAEGFCKGALRTASWQPGDGLLLDGIRHRSIVVIVRQLVAPVPFRLVVVDTPDQIRHSRWNKAGGEDHHIVPLSAIDEHSISADASSLLQTADFVVSGAGTATEAANSIVSWLRTIPGHS